VQVTCKEGARFIGLALLVAPALVSCSTAPARIVDCAPGFHNVAGPDSNCVPDTPARSATPTATS